MEPRTWSTESGRSRKTRLSRKERRADDLLVLEPLRVLQDRGSRDRFDRRLRQTLVARPEGHTGVACRFTGRRDSRRLRSVYLYFPDRDALVAATMERCHAEMLQVADEAEAAHQDPALGLRARILAQAAWVQEHSGLYKVMHESKVGMPFKEAVFTRTTAAVQRCMDAGVASPGNAATVALDLRTAVIGMLSQRINEPDLPWPPFSEQADRFLFNVGIAPPAEETTVPQGK